MDFHMCTLLLSDCRPYFHQAPAASGRGFKNVECRVRMWRVAFAQAQEAVGICHLARMVSVQAPVPTAANIMHIQRPPRLTHLGRLGGNDHAPSVQLASSSRGTASSGSVAAEVPAMPPATACGKIKDGLRGLPRWRKVQAAACSPAPEAGGDGEEASPRQDACLYGVGWLHLRYSTSTWCSLMHGMCDSL